MENTATLQVLSKQHSEDRLRCRELKKDIQQQRDKNTLRQNIIRFWKNSLQQHVETEERILFPFLQKYPFSHNYVTTLKREHDTIRTLAERLPLHDDGYYLYKVFIDLVEQHSDFEDEILFPRMKAELPPQDLARLNQSLQQR